LTGEDLTHLTHGLDLLHHAGAQLLDPHLHPATSAGGTLLYGPGLPAQPIASITDDVLLQGQFPHSSVVHVLQGHGQLVHKIFGSSWASLTSAAEGVSASEEHVENVHRIAGEPSASSHASLLDGLLSALVVQTSLFRVGQDLIGVGDLLELLTSIRVFVRVVFEGELTVSFLQR